MVFDKRTLINGFAGAALAIGLSVSPALADDPQITIRYGENIEDMDMWIEIIQEEGVMVQGLGDLENPNCAVVYSDGKELYRFSKASVDGATLADIAIAIGKGDKNHGFTKSDCPPLKSPTSD